MLTSYSEKANYKSTFLQEKPSSYDNAVGQCKNNQMLRKKVKKYIKLTPFLSTTPSTTIGKKLYLHYTKKAINKINKPIEKIIDKEFEAMFQKDRKEAMAKFSHLLK